MKKVGLVALTGVLALNANAEDVIVEEAVEQSCFDAVYGGLGIGGSFNKVEVKLPAQNKGESKNFNRFIGSLVLGGGKAFKGKYYLGAEALFDFTGSKKKDYFGNEYKVDNKGFNPQLGVRLGYVFNNNNMVYLKTGMGYSKAKVEKDQGDSRNVSEWSPFIALGGEKSFCNKFSARFEAEYDFGKSKSFNMNNTNVKVEKLNKGWVVRALINYNIKY